MSDRKERVLVTVDALSRSGDDDDTPERITLRTVGTLSRTAGGWQIDYTEEPKKDEKNRITIAVEGSQVMMTRSGSTRTCMIFEKGKRFDGAYQTEFGALDMGIYATQVETQLTDGPSGRIHLHYQLDMQGGFAAVHDLEILFCPA